MYKFETHPDPSIIFSYVDVRDLAEAHVRALDNSLASNQRILVAAGSFTYQAVLDVLISYKHNHSSTFNNDDLLSDARANGARMDTNKAARILNFTEYRPFSASLIDLITQLELLEKSEAEVSHMPQTLQGDATLGCPIFHPPSDSLASTSQRPVFNSARNENVCPVSHHAQSEGVKCPVAHAGA